MPHFSLNKNIAYMGHFVLLVTYLNDHRNNALRGDINDKSHFPFMPHFPQMGHFS